MIVDPLLELVADAEFVEGPDVVVLPMAPPPPLLPVVAAACVRVPVHVAPVGQQAMFFA